MYNGLKYKRESYNRETAQANRGQNSTGIRIHEMRMNRIRLIVFQPNLSKDDTRHLRKGGGNRKDVQNESDIC